MDAATDHDRLDPRRAQRAVPSRDLASLTRTVSTPRMYELVITLLVRLGLVR